MDNPASQKVNAHSGDPFSTFMDKPSSDPLVSVIIPTYNRADILPRSLGSVLNQTFRNVEVIVVDDGSRDQTEATVQGFEDPRVTYIRHQTNQGPSAARNTGIKVARGEYIAFQDSDDKWYPDKLQRQMDAFASASPNVGVVYSGYWRVEGKNRVYIPPPWIQKKEGDIHHILLKENFIGLPTAIVRRECFARAGDFDISLPCLEDWELWIRVSRHYHFQYIDEPLMVSYFTSGSVNHQSQEKQAFALRSMYKKHHEDFTSDRLILANYHYALGTCLCNAGDVREGLLHFLRASTLNPLKLTLITRFLLHFSRE
jgi:glycosyltransferase involved in cell wall biosynthesis